MESKFERCDICHEYHYSDKECNPIFYYKHSSCCDKFQEIRAFDFEDAAEKFAITYNEVLESIKRHKEYKLGRVI